MKKKLIACLVAVAMFLGLFGFNLNTSASSGVEITSYGGSMECAYATWDQYDDVNDYVAYIKESHEDESQYKKVDNSLIRKYKDYFRVDVLGLTPGWYNIKVIPYDGGALLNEAAAVTPEIEVIPHVREGFAFSENSSIGGNAPGGYNSDGTPADDAVILYVTSEDVNDIEHDVITSEDGKKTSFTGLTNIINARKKGFDNRPLIVRIIGHLQGSEISGLYGDKYLDVRNCKNITIEGVGNDAALKGCGIYMKRAENIEVRNLAIMLFGDDGVSIDNSNINIWIHNNDFMYGTAGKDSDQVKGDGSCDIKKNSSFITISYNHFWDSGKSSLCGLDETVEYFVTYHHNWFDHSDSRHPRLRLATAHIYNNYYDGNSKFGVGAACGCSAFVEANVFRNCKNPMLISGQGSDSGYFSGEDGGMIKAYNNIVNNAASFIYHTQNGYSFDAYMANSRNEVVPSSYATVVGGHKYNNFDTNPEVMYYYEPHDPSEVAEDVETYAGRMYGGDFEWEFNDAYDDTSSDLNEGLMAKINSYETELVSVGSAAPEDLPLATTPPVNENEQPPTEAPSVTPDVNNQVSDEKTPIIDITPQQEEYVVGAYIYKITSAEKKTAMLCKPVSKKIKKANVKATVIISSEKYKVTAIGKKAFFKCKKLKSISIKGSNLKKIGKNAFKNTGKSVKVKANKKKLKIYRRLLKKAGLK